MTLDLFVDPVAVIATRFLAWHVAVDVAARGPAATAAGGTIRTLIAAQKLIAEHARKDPS